MRITKCETMTETEQMPLEKLVSTDLLHPGLPHTCYLSKKTNKQTQCVQSAIKQDKPVLSIPSKVANVQHIFD